MTWDFDGSALEEAGPDRGVGLPVAGGVSGASVPGAAGIAVFGVTTAGSAAAVLGSAPVLHRTIATANRHAGEVHGIMRPAASDSRVVAGVIDEDRLESAIRDRLRNVNASAWVGDSR